MAGSALPVPAAELVEKTLGMPDDYGTPELYLRELQVHGLAPLLYQDLRGRSLESRFPKQILESLRAAYIHSVATHTQLFHELEGVLEAFSKAGITPILMKGAHLSESLYGEGCLRPMGDIDLLIRPEEFSRAREVFPSLGYVPEKDVLWYPLDSNRAGYGYSKGTPPRWVCFEVHNRPVHGHKTGNYSGFEVDRIFERASEISVGGATALGMGPADLLLFLCHHYRFHEFERLIWLYDIGLVWQRYGPSLDRRALVEYARKLNLSTTLRYCLGFARDLLGVSVDQQLLASLEPPYLPRKLAARVLGSRGYRVLGESKYRPLRVALQHLMVQRNLDFLRLSGRLLFPTTAALGSRYVKNRVWRLKLIKLFYVVHPFCVLAMGLRAALALARRKG